VDFGKSCCDVKYVECMCYLYRLDTENAQLVWLAAIGAEYVVSFLCLVSSLI